jgi:hypothetical protein
VYSYPLGEIFALEGSMMVVIWDGSIAGEDEGDWRTLVSSDMMDSVPPHLTILHLMDSQHLAR